VSGAGSAEYNGTYKRVPNATSGLGGHFPIFVMRKPGEKPEKFAIYQAMDHWWIGKWMKRSYPGTNECYHEYYRSMSRSNVNEKLPPSLWMNRGGKAPPPFRPFVRTNSVFLTRAVRKNVRQMSDRQSPSDHIPTSSYVGLLLILFSHVSAVHFAYKSVRRRADSSL